MDLAVSAPAVLCLRPRASMPQSLPSPSSRLPDIGVRKHRPGVQEPGGFCASQHRDPSSVLHPAGPLAFQVSLAP